VIALKSNTATPVVLREPWMGVVIPGPVSVKLLVSKVNVPAAVGNAPSDAKSSGFSGAAPGPHHLPAPPALPRIGTPRTIRAS